MKNAGTILLSAGVLLVGFALITPLLFFLIEVILGKTGDASILLEMEYASLSFIGLGMIVVGSFFSPKRSPIIIVSSVVAALAMVGSFLASNPKCTFDWIVTGCYYLSLITALSVGIVILHTRHS